MLKLAINVEKRVVYKVDSNHYIRSMIVTSSFSNCSASVHDNEVILLFSRY